ncbi:MAG: hypothetical protein K2X50_04770 [Gammaproteobacteria bacterium]|nr:hypothetical protein [Gammaproteobacteria bacterium]
MLAQHNLKIEAAASKLILKPQLKAGSKTWARLVAKVYEVDPPWLQQLPSLTQANGHFGIDHRLKVAFQLSQCSALFLLYPSKLNREFHRFCQKLFRELN